MLAIALVKGWQNHALTQVQKKEDVRCVLVAREPLARLTSMYMYFRSAGEYWLRPVAEELKAFADIDASIEHMWKSMGKDTMLDTHQYLKDSLDFGCARIAFESFTSQDGLGGTFNASAMAAFTGWGIDPRAHASLLDHVQKLDLARKTAAELKSDHHHTASKFPPGFKREVREALGRNADVMALMRVQLLSRPCLARHVQLCVISYWTGRYKTRWD